MDQWLLLLSFIKNTFDIRYEIHTRNSTFWKFVSVDKKKNNLKKTDKLEKCNYFVRVSRILFVPVLRSTMCRKG